MPIEPAVAFSAGGDFPFVAADVGDFSQLFWLLALMIIGAINYVANRLQEKRAAEEEEKISREVERHNAEVERQQVQGPPPAPQSQPASQPPPPPSRTHSAGDELRNFFQSLVAPVVETPPPPPPPRQSPPPAKEKPASSLSRAEQKALEAIKERGQGLPPTRRERRQAGEAHSGLNKMLRDPASLRNAFVLKELLDPPIALREFE